MNFIELLCHGQDWLYDCVTLNCLFLYLKLVGDTLQSQLEPR